MLLKRRCGISDILSYIVITGATLFVLLIVAVVYGTRTESASLPQIVREVLPAGRCLCDYSTTFSCDTCLDCAVNQSVVKVVGEEDGKDWTFEYRRDASNYGLSEKQCKVAFPGLFEDINRAMKLRRRNPVTESELSSVELSKGMVKAMIYGGELYIIQTRLVDSTNREKALATLHSLHRAVISSPARNSIPNIEFIISVEDLPADPSKSLWVQARRAQDTNLWLIPDFALWSWDVPQLGAFSEVAADVKHREELQPWDTKTEKLVWRGKVSMAPKLRRALIEAAKGKSWSDVKQVWWGEESFEERFLGAVEQCDYMFIAHAEGRSYSGSLKYRQLCRSVVVSHKLQWIQHHHYLLKSSGSHQNFVEVERDFSDLDAAMKDLLKHPEKAKRIANNSVQTFRERYLTPAAEACYWRALIQAWGIVSFSPSPSVDGGVDGKHRKRGVRFETFAIFDTQKQMEYSHNSS